MKVDKIHIKHPFLGEIVVFGTIKKEINEQIGNTVSDSSKEPKYYCDEITKNEDGTFHLKNLEGIEPESLNVGYMDNSKGKKTLSLESPAES